MLQPFLALRGHGCPDHTRQCGHRGEAVVLQQLVEGEAEVVHMFNCRWLRPAGPSHKRVRAATGAPRGNNRRKRTPERKSMILPSSDNFPASTSINTPIQIQAR